MLLITPSTRLAHPPLSQRIGRGAYGQVYPHPGHPEWVVKICAFGALDNEYRLGLQLRHPHIVRIHGLVPMTPLEWGRELHALVMDRVVGKTTEFIRKTLQNLPLIQRGLLLKQLADVCHYLFTHRIGWEDLNCTNLMLSEDLRHMTVIDLGAWRAFDAGATPFSIATDLIYACDQIISSLLRFNVNNTRPFMPGKALVEGSESTVETYLLGIFIEAAASEGLYVDTDLSQRVIDKT